MNKAILKGDTSLNANVQKGQNRAQIKKLNFKYSIAQKVSDDAIYWLKPLNKADDISEE